MVTKMMLEAVMREKGKMTRLSYIPHGYVMYTVHTPNTKGSRNRAMKALVKARAIVSRFEILEKDILGLFVGLRPESVPEFVSGSQCDSCIYTPPLIVQGEERYAAFNAPQEELALRLPCDGAATLSYEPPNVRVFSESIDQLLSGKSYKLNNTRGMAEMIRANADAIAAIILYN